MKLKNIGNRIKDDNLDLSLCDLEEVPVEEIVSEIFQVIFIKN